MRKLLTILYILALTAHPLAAEVVQTPPHDSLSTRSAELTDRLLDAALKLSDADYAGAQADLRTIVLADSTMDAAWYYLGLSSYYLGDAAGAEEGLSHAVAIDSTNNWYLESLAQLYSGTSRQGEAGDIYLKLLERNPAKYRNPYTLTLIADRCFSVDDTLAARTYYEQALLFDEHYLPAMLGLADVLRYEGHAADGLDILIRFAAMPEVSPDPKCRYVQALLGNLDGRTFEEQGERVRALTATLVATHPDYMPAHEIDLQLQLFYGLLPDAIERCLAMMALAPDDRDNMVNCYGVIGDALQQMGDSRMAFKYYDKALRLNSRCLPVLNNYAYYLALQGKKLRKALRMSKITVTDAPDNATYLDTYGWILHLRGRDAEAKPVFKQAILHGGKSNAVVLMHYAIVLEALGETDLASYYRKLAQSR